MAQSQRKQRRFPRGQALFGIACSLAAGSCASFTELPSAPAPPLLRWVLDDVHSVGGERPTLVGGPRVQSQDALSALHFNGMNDGLVLPLAPLQGLARFTVEILLRPEVDGPQEQRFFHSEDREGHRVLLELRLDRPTRRWCLDTYLHKSNDEHQTLLDRSKTHPAGHWYWVALVYDGATMTHYVSGAKESEGRVFFPAMSAGQSSLGMRLNRVNWFKGAIREVRIYDRALAGSELSR